MPRPYGEDSRAPRTPREEALCALFAEVLELDQVGIDDNFFQLGGHSQLAIRLVVRIRSRMGFKASISDLFDHPDVAGLAEQLERARVGPQPAVPKLRPMRDGGERRP